MSPIVGDLTSPELFVVHNRPQNRARSSGFFAKLITATLALWISFVYGLEAHFQSLWAKDTMLRTCPILLSLGVALEAFTQKFGFVIVIYHDSPSFLENLPETTGPHTNGSAVSMS